MSILFNCLSRQLSSSVKLLEQLKSRNTIPVSNLFKSVKNNVYDYDDYLQRRNNTIQQYEGVSIDFKSKLRLFVNHLDTKIFSTDLKVMAHIAESEDIELVLDMIRKIKIQEGFKHTHFSNLNTEIMKMFHYLNAPLEALTMYENLKQFIHHPLVYLILLDILYENMMYEKMYTFHEETKCKLLEDSNYFSLSLIYIIAACYKENTQESYDYSRKVWSEHVQRDRAPTKAALLAAGLALKQGEPDVALELQADHNEYLYPELRNVKVMAYLEMDLLVEAMAYLHMLVTNHLPPSPYTLSEEVITKLRDVIRRVGDTCKESEYENIATSLRERDFITDKTVEDMLMTPVRYPFPEYTNEIKYIIS